MALGLSAIVSAVPAAAQPAPTPQEVQQAQARWSEGKRAFEAGNYEEARVAFKQAYTLLPHHVFLQNLGEAELRTGRHVDAARHFSRYLRQSTALAPKDRELATRSLEKAAENLGALVIESNVGGVEVRVDDEVVGKTPLDGAPWYVEPGKHVVTLRKEGYQDVTETVEVPVGPPKSVALPIRSVKDSTPTPPPPPPPSPPPASESSSTPLYILLGGAGATVAAMVVGSVFAIEANKDGNDSDTARRTLDRLTNNNSRTACGTNGPASSDVLAACSSLASTASARQDHETGRNVAFVTAGILAVATVTTYLLWPRASDSTTSGAPRAAISFAPRIGVGEGGIQIRGAF